MDLPPVLWLVVPCYNEEQVLPRTAKCFLSKVNDLSARGMISPLSRVLFVDDGSRDSTWRIIQEFAAGDERVLGLKLSRNRGHQNALLAGLLEAVDQCDVTVSLDCDGQDDISAVDEMLKAYGSGSEVVYGVRSSRDSDTLFKRKSAELFYGFLNKLGAESVFNHADYRLMSNKALKAFEEFGEVNLYLRGIVPLVGFESSEVSYVRHERIAGESHYPIRKMLGLAFDGITSLSMKPLRIIMAAGFAFFLLGLLLAVWAVVSAVTGNSVAGWASTICIISTIGGIQLFALGIIGEYVGKIYLETKHRPRFIVEERTWVR